MKSAVCLALLLAGCVDLPRDPEGTLDRITAERRFSVGLVAPLTPATPEIAALMRELERSTGARARPVTGAHESLLLGVEEGRVDLALGFFERKTPWERRVALAPPLDAAAPEDKAITLRPAMQSGENRWIMLVERTTRAVAER